MGKRDRRIRLIRQAPRVRGTKGSSSLTDTDSSVTCEHDLRNVMRPSIVPPRPYAGRVRPQCGGWRRTSR